MIWPKKVNNVNYCWIKMMNLFDVDCKIQIKMNNSISSLYFFLSWTPFVVFFIYYYFNTCFIYMTTKWLLILSFQLSPPLVLVRIEPSPSSNMTQSPFSMLPTIFDCIWIGFQMTLRFPWFPLHLNRLQMTSIWFLQNIRLSINEVQTTHGCLAIRITSRPWRPPQFFIC